MKDAKPEKFADMKPRDRLKHLKERMLETHDTQHIDAKLDILLDTAGVGSEGDGMFIVGETGVGKTTAVRMFTDRIFEKMRAEDPSGTWLRPEIAGTDLRPIVHVTSSGIKRPIPVVLVNKRPTWASFLEDTAAALQVSLPRNCRFGEAQRRINLAMKTQEIKMVIFDEVQHIIDGGLNSYDAADVFKLLVKSRLQVVCIGLTYALDLGEVNDQLERLVRDQEILQPLQCTIGDFPQVNAKGKPIGPELKDLTEFRQLMENIDHRDGIESVLPFDKPSNLSSPDMALRIHRAGHGYVGKFLPLIHEASKLAIYDGSDFVTKGHFAEAYRRATRCNDADNWFVIPLTEVEQRFVTVRKKQLMSTGKTKKKLQEHMSKRSHRRIEDVIAGRD